MHWKYLGSLYCCVSESEGFELTQLRHFTLLCLWSYMVIFHKNSLHFRHKKKSAWINRRQFFVNLQPLRFFSPISLFTLIPRLLRRGLYLALWHNILLDWKDKVPSTSQSFEGSGISLLPVLSWISTVCIYDGQRAPYPQVMYTTGYCMQIWPLWNYFQSYPILNGFSRMETLKLGRSRTAALFSLRLAQWEPLISIYFLPLLWQTICNAFIIILTLPPRLGYDNRWW